VPEIVGSSNWLQGMKQLKEHSQHLNVFGLTKTSPQTMDIGQGAFVGMTILPAGSEEETQTSEQEDSNTEFSEETALVLVTKKVRGLHSDFPQYNPIRL